MAKVCRNCGRKIGFSEKAYSLKESRESLCSDCGTMVSLFLNEIKSAKNLDLFKEKQRELRAYLQMQRFSADTQKCIEREIQAISSRKTKELFQSRNTAVTFEADFLTCCEMIQSCADGEMVNQPQIIELGHTKVAAFVFEQYFFRNDSYTSLSVTLVHCDGVACVTAVASGGGESVLNIDLDSGDDYVKSFWTQMHLNYPETEFKSFRTKTPDELQHRAIGVLGGTFDPVHNGHIALARAALMQANLKKLIVMPAHVQPFKLGNEISDDHHRLEMAKLAFADMPEAEVSDYEIVHTEVSYTYDTLCSLKEMYPDDEIAFIMGTDSFLALDTWYMGRELLEQFSFLVSVRPGYRESELEDKIEEFRRLYDTNVEKLVMTMPDVSSTEIRTRYESGLSNAGNVPDLIERYIYEHGLYK